MVDLLARIDQASRDDHPYFGTRTARELDAEIGRLGDAATWNHYLQSGVAELRLGNETKALERLTEAYRKVHAADGAPGPVVAQVTFYLAVGHMRFGETQNCCRRRTAESCILPIRGGGIHAEQEGSRNAARYLLEVLERSPAGSNGYLSALWLLNVTHMTLGSYPDGVPERYRIPARAFEPEIDFPSFVNVSGGLGLDTFNLAGGVIVDDFDGDDDLDIVSSTWDTAGQLRFFRNAGDGTFEDRTDPSGLRGLFGGLNLVQADHDNDGDLDFLVLRGAWLGAEGRHPNSLIRNNGDGTFTDVTFESGLGERHYPTQTAAWADYDNDGDLDLYVGNETSGPDPHPCQLFRNEGDGTFTDVAAAAGVENLGYAKAVTWGDVDGDRFPDLYVSNNGGPNRLYRNNGDGTFVDVAPEQGVTGPEQSFPAWFWDYDNDGALDLFVSVYNAGIQDLATHYLGRPARFELPRLYRGDGRGRFRDVAPELGLTYPILPMGSNFGDVDNDGYLDFYLGTGDVSYFTLMPNVMFLNRGGSAFTNVTMAGGLGHLQKGHGIAFADLDGDGDQDVFAQMGGAWPGDKFADALFVNPGFGNRWITVALQGTGSNRSAIGARIHVTVEEGGRERSIYRHVNSGGSFGANPLRQTIGLGRAERIRSIELFWPATGETQVVEGVTPDQAIRIVEGLAGFTRIDLAEVSLR